MLAAVESFGYRKARVRAAYRLRTPRLSNPSQDAEEVLSGFLKITQHAMVKRRSWVNIAVCPCLQPSLTHHRNINPFENKMWEIYFYKKVFRLFIIFDYVTTCICGYTTNTGRYNNWNITIKTSSLIWFLCFMDYLMPKPSL